MHLCVLAGRWHASLCIGWQVTCIFVYWLAGGMHLCVLNGMWHASLCIDWQVTCIFIGWQVAVIAFTSSIGTDSLQLMLFVLFGLYLPFNNLLVISLGVLMTRQPLWVTLCRLLEKGRKEIEEMVEEIKDRGREERGTGIKVNRRNKNIPPLPLPATRIAGLTQL